MCGLVGAIGAPVEGVLQCVERACANLMHRGPDDSGTITSRDGFATLGHTRLSIVDTSSAGHQPMVLDDRYYLVFNGEIYNHRDLRRELESLGEFFTSCSDSEVVLRAYRQWGDECVDRFVGMFAFVVYDGQEQICFAARDRAGEKPFFFVYSNRTLFFASELKALFEFPQVDSKLDMEALHHYLAFGRSPTDKSLVQGIQKLKPGHTLRLDLQTNGLSTNTFWKIPRFRQTEASEQDLLVTLEKLLEDAVGMQIEADVPVGVLLSGGVDSSLTTALASRRSAKLRTYTVTLPGDPDRCEAPYANLIAEYFDTEHTNLDVGEPDVDILDRLAVQYDDPIADSSMIPTYLVSESISQHCKVAVGGDGGDELFGGYHSYNWRLKNSDRLRHVPNALSRLVGAAGIGIIPIGMRGRGLARMLKLGIDPQFWPNGYSFDSSERTKLLMGMLPTTFPEDNHSSLAQSFGPGIGGMARTDFSGYLIDDLLVKVDRASMLNSLEIRAPFLDHRIIEFAFRDVPDASKATLTERKRLLKLLCKRILPDEFDLERKQGFSVPYLDWLRLPAWQSFFRETLLDSNVPIFDKKQMEKYLKAGTDNRAVAPQLFGLVMLERWRANYGISF